MVNQGIAQIVELRKQNKLTYYKLDRETGEIIECSNLPADTIFFQQYLQRGMVVDRSLLEAESRRIKAKLGGLPEGELTCDVCQKSFKNKIGLLGHKRTHK